jgi:hypothetical protein
MKKLFLLIPALVLSLMAKAADQYPDPAVDNSLATAVSAVGSGETIYLDEGIYTNSDASDYTKIRGGKNITFKAIEGKNPVVQLKYAFQIREASSAKFMGIKFDGTNLAYDSYFLAYDATDNTWEFEDCEFTALSKYVIQYGSDKKVASVVFNKCYFHDITKSCIYIDNTGEANLTVRNSTFANIDASAVSAGMVESKTATGAVLVDHCTFYNCKVKNTDYGTIKVASPNATVSNCIFAMPTSTDNLRTVYVPSGLEAGTTVTHCIMHNYTKDSNIGIPSRTGLTKEECNAVDPLFNDLANSKYTFAGDWTTMNLSPARGAATDGTDLGDPRWYSAEVLPSVDFASPYVLDGLHAKLNGNIALDEDNFLKQNNNSDPTQHGTATWKIHATKSCYVSVTPDIKGGSGHHYQIAIYDANNNLICEPLAENDSWASDITPNFGTILIPAGDYKVVLSNLMNNSGATLRKITLAYIGGDVQVMPGTTNIADAWFSSNGTRADGKISYSSISSGCWAKWNINVTAAGTYNVTVNISGQYGHKYVVEFLKEGESTPIVVTKGTTNYDNDPTLYANELGSVILEAANYEMKVFNDVGDAALHSVKLEYAGGGVQNMPGTTELMEAWFSSNGTRNNGAIEYTSVSSGCWAKWNLAFAKGGNFNVIVNIRGQYGHQYVVEFLKEGESTPIVVTKDAINYHNDPTLYANELGMVTLEAGNYEMKVSNNIGDAALISVTLEYLGGAVVNIPNAIPLADALLHDGATRDNEGLHFKNAQYVEWNIHATEGLYTFAATCTSSNYSNLTIKVKQGTSEKYSYTPQYSYTGDKVISSPQWLLDEGDYTLELSNPTSGSGYITTLSATAATDVFILDENTEDDGSIAAAAATEEEYTFLLKRSFTAGKYYTICIPVGSWNDELKLAFGADYELWKMSSAIQSGDEIALNFEQINGESFHAGMPYIIKPSVDVKNPILYNKKEIKNSTYNNVQEFTAADFVGTFYKDVIPAGESNLYLQNNNLYYSPTNNTPIKGTRAWIRLKPQGAGAAPRARIVLGEQVATDINLVNDEIVNGTVKTIENGQLVIIRDGIRYNVMGAKIQ